MKLKSIPIWLKGGIAGLMIMILILITGPILGNLSSNYDSCFAYNNMNSPEMKCFIPQLIMILFNILAFPLLAVTIGAFGHPNYVIITIIYFGIGSLIGWIISVLKKIKKNSK